MNQQKILTLYRQGLGIKAIARELDTYPNAVKRALIKMGIYNLDPEDRVTAISNQGDNQVTNGSKPGKQENLSGGDLAKQTETIAKRGPEHCSKWQTCGVCNLEQEQRERLEEMYLMGFPEPLLAAYFKVSPTDLASHAWLKHWWSKRKKHEDPTRKEIERESLSRELWKTIMASSL